MVATVVCCILFSTACSAADGDSQLLPNSENDAADDAAASEPAAVTEDDSQTSVAAAPTEPAVWNDDAAYLGYQYDSIVPGSYRIESAGTPFTLSVGDNFFVQPNSYSQFVLTHSESQGPDDRDIDVRRFTHLADPTDLSEPLDATGSSWPADDFEGWLDNLSGQVVLTDRQATTIGGLDAIHVELQLADVECHLEWGCVQFGSNHFVTGRALNMGATYRIWMIDQDQQDPLYVIVAVSRDEDVAWFETANQVLATLAFGEPGKNPIEPLSAGANELEFLGGISVDLPTDLNAVYDPAGRLAADGQYTTEFLLNPRTFEGEVIENADTLVAHLETTSVAVTEIEPTVIDGLEARVFDIGIPGNPSPTLMFFDDASAGWAAPPRARLWVVEHPDRGLLVVTAEAFWEPDDIFPIVLDQTESIVESLEFIDLG